MYFLSFNNKPSIFSLLSIMFMDLGHNHRVDVNTLRPHRAKDAWSCYYHQIYTAIKDD